MKALVITGHLTEGKLGKFGADLQFEKHSLCVGSGKSLNNCLNLSSILTFETRYSVLPALSLDGILAVDIVQGSFNKVSFAHFINGLLGQMNPFSGPNSVIVMDNCRIHKSKTILEMIHKWYVSQTLTFSSYC
jgi:hypothetical protein